MRQVRAEENILEMAEEDSIRSIRTIARHVCVAQSTVRRTLQEAQLYPYHLQRVQALQPHDYAAWVQFCTWLLQQNKRNNTFTQRVLVTVEGTFTRNGVNHFYNTHVWAMENTHASSRTHFQQRFAVNVKTDIVNRLFIGSFILPRQADWP